MRVPVDQPYKVTTGFGVPDSNAKFGRHSGIDYAVPTGRPVYAPASGQLTKVVSPTGGNMVVIFDGKYYHRLMHNSAFSRDNGNVSEGQEVAKAGTTGLSTGPHVHWDVNTQGTYPTSFSAFVDPNKLLEGGNVADKVTPADLPDMVRGYLFREPNPDDNVHIGKTWPQAQSDFIHSPQRADAQRKYDNFPSLEEVEHAFKVLQPWQPIDPPDFPNQRQYYTHLSKDVLYKDLAEGLKNRLDSIDQPIPPQVTELKPGYYKVK